jgi:hypothetical protein
MHPSSGSTKSTGQAHTIASASASAMKPHHHMARLHASRGGVAGLKQHGCKLREFTSTRMVWSKLFAGDTGQQTSREALQKVQPWQAAGKESTPLQGILASQGHAELGGCVHDLPE